MNQELLLILGQTIREKRTSKNITLDKLATKANVSKGLISQIEHGRTLPSLSVLFDLINALDENVKDFFTNLHDGTQKNDDVVILHPAQQVSFKKEPVKGFEYKRIFARSLVVQTIDTAILELQPGAARRKYISTEAFELKYIIEGEIQYQIRENMYRLNTGDALFFDGRAPHRLKNIGKKTAKMLVVYFF